MVGIDPRAENCRAHRMDGNGKVVGVHLTHMRRDASAWELVEARLIDEYRAGQSRYIRVHVYDHDLKPVPAVVTLAYPFQGTLNFQHRLTGIVDVGRGYVDHVMGAAFTPPDLGPYAIYVGGGLDSDVIGGMGLPHGHHVSFDVVFRLRGATGPTEPQRNDEVLRYIQEARAALNRAEEARQKELVDTGWW